MEEVEWLVLKKDVERLGPVTSADALFAALRGFVEPAFQNRLVFGFGFEENDAGAHVGLGVDDFRLSLEEGIAGGNLDEHECSYRERIHHIQIAAVEAQFADARSNTHIRSLFNELSAGNKCIPWRATAFCSQ